MNKQWTLTLPLMVVGLLTILVACNPQPIEPFAQLDVTAILATRIVTPAATPTPSLTPDPTLQALMRELPAPPREMVETFIAFAPAARAEIKEAILTAEAPKVEMTPYPTNTPALGIIESGDFFIVHPPRRVAIENIWQGEVAGRLVRVYAGLLKPDPRTPFRDLPPPTYYGALQVLTELPGVLYTTEEEVGALRIQAVVDAVVVLEAAGYGDQPAQTLYFDLIDRVFVDSPPVIVP